jgi:DNA helicase-2/ATP-dependent DNA helicase PcrA
MTRAKDHLQIVVPQRFFVTQQSQFGDRHIYAGRTRFIPSGLLDRFETKSWPPAETAPANSVTKSKEEVVDLLAKMKAMWK